jgi:hypothetical protein
MQMASVDSSDCGEKIHKIKLRSQQFVVLLGKIVAGTTKHVDLEMLQRVASPFPASDYAAFVAGSTTRIAPRVVGLLGRPKEANTHTFGETFNDVVADIHSLLRSMNAAFQRFHGALRSSPKAQTSSR